MTDSPGSSSSSGGPPAWPEGVPRAGETVGGKYVCERVLGSGGMGVVIAARHAQLGQQVAVKVLLPVALQDPAAAERFLREARAVIAIKSDHVARVMDFGTLDNGSPYLVMEHLEGTDLKALLAQRHPLPVESVADYAIQACEALYEAHQRGIVHRDLKPANLFVTSRVDGSPHVKVLDFGISKTVSLATTANGSGHSITKTDAVFGTPAYMSPEQLRSSKLVDQRTDVWSMGVTLYELASNKLPFGGPGDGVVTMVAHILEDSPAGLRELRADVPAGFESAIAKCLAKNPADRFQSAAELAEALASYGSAASAETLGRIARMSVDSLPFEATIRSDSQALSGRPAPPVSSGWGSTGGKTTKKTAVGLAAGAAAILAIAVGAGWVLGTRSTTSAASATSVSTPTDESPSQSAPAVEAAPSATATQESAAATASASARPESAATTATTTTARPTPPSAATKPEPTTSAEPEPPKCAAGMVMSNGHCCRAGFDWKGGECVPGVAKGLR